ncbi:MAG TPA: hypothetical protein VGM16_01475 [Gammaproteobacteria bacterium]|jgi:hypothetical protein
MNTTSRLSTAIVLGLGLLGMSAADAASARPVTKAQQVQSGVTSHASGKVIHLGTILVTPADKTGAKAPAAKGTLDLGEVDVTAADTLEARAARQHTVYLGSIEVTPANSAARYAVAGTVDLGVVSVRAKAHRVPVIGSLVAAIDSTHSRSMLAAVGALVFARAGG